MPDPRRYLAYGSNLHPTRLAERAPSACLAGTAVIAGWRLHFHKRSFVDRSGKAAIEPAAGTTARIHAAVFTLDEDDEAALDRFEGLGFGYEKTVLDVPGIGPAFTYVAAADAIDRRLRPFGWYRALVAAGARFHGFPASYLALIEAVPVVDDADREREARHHDLLARCLAG